MSGVVVVNGILRVVSVSMQKRRKSADTILRPYSVSV